MDVLPTIWFVAIGALWIGYLVLEGFDLGVGMHMLFTGRSDAQRRVRISSTRGKVTLAAPNHVLLAASGAAIHMHGGAITCTGADISPMTAQGMRWAGLGQDGSDYFDWHHTDNASVVEPWMVNNSRNILFCARCFDAFERLVETDAMIANLHSYLDGAL